jgi:predicted NAD/FAD-binding protein
LNDSGKIRKEHILQKITYHHPVFTPGVIGAQRRHDDLNGKRRLFFCGAYWGYGFHEDGVNSALAVCRHFGIGLDQWKAAFTKDESVTLASAQ